MSHFKVSIKRNNECIAGSPDCTTLSLKLVSGTDHPDPWMIVESYQREDEKIRKRSLWEFKELGSDFYIQVTNVDDVTADTSDILDERPGILVKDERLIIRENINHLKRSSERLQKQIDEEKQKPPRENSQEKDVLFCSFCGRGKSEVNHLVAGNNVFICNGCVSICNEVIEEKENN